jgi:hypothetical protein
VTSRWIDLTTNELRQLRQRADAYLEDCRKYHLPDGQIASVRYADTNRSQVVGYEDLDQSAAWTGFFLTGAAFRYTVTRDTKSLQDIRQALDGVETLLSVSGRPGYVARFAGRSEDPAYQKYYAKFGGADSGRPGFGRWAYTGTGNRASLVWLGNTSRDNYAGLNLGLITSWQLVRDQAIRGRIATNISVMLDRLIADQWRLNDGHSNTTFCTPLLAAAVLRAGASVEPRRYQALYEEKVREAMDVPVTGSCRFCDYGDATFAFANLMVLTRMETNQTRKLVFQDKCNQLWREAGDHLNPWFAAAYVSTFEARDSTARATLQGILFQYPPGPRWSVPMDHSERKDLIFVAANGQTWSKLALPLNYQPPAPFQWAQSPFSIKGGREGVVAYPGLDLVVPFWMGREGNMIPSEDAPPPAPPAPRVTPRRTNSPPAAVTPKK